MQLGQKVEGTDDLAVFLLQLGMGQHREFVHAFFLDDEMRLCWNETLDRGSTSAVLLDLRELIKLALRVNARGMIVAHNHPSGDVRPSASDIAVTHKLTRLCSMIGIELVDHLIVAQDSCLSFKAERLL